MTAGERLGVFGGTFDPPHVGHLVTAINVRHELRLDKVLLVVANQPWQKTGTRRISPAVDRLAMVQAAVADVDGLAASASEIERGGDSYTADTLEELREEDPTRELYVILGSDAASGLDTWERIERLADLASVVVVDRPGVEPRIFMPPGVHWTRVEVPRLEVSSTDLRARVADGRPLDYLLAPAVMSSIASHDLYRLNDGN